MILLPEIVMIYLYSKLFGGLNTILKNSWKLKNNQNFPIHSRTNDLGTSSGDISDPNKETDNYVLESSGNLSIIRSETVSRFRSKKSDGCFVKGGRKSKMERNSQKSNNAALTLRLLIAGYSIVCLSFFIVSII